MPRLSGLAGNDTEGGLPRSARTALGVVGVLGGLSVLVGTWAVLSSNPADLAVFLRAGRDLAAGNDPYAAPGTLAVWSGSAYVYPWVVALPFAVLATLPTMIAIVVFRAVSIVAVVGACRLAGARRALVALALVGSSVFLLGLQQGTLDALLFLGVVLAWRWRDRPALLASVLALLVVSELFMWPLLVWAWFTSRKKAAISAGAVAALAIALGSLGGEPLGGYFRSLSELSRHEGPHSVSLFALATRAGLSTIGASVLAVLVALTILGLAVLAERRTGRPVGLTGALGAALVAMPILWSHYLLLLALPLVLGYQQETTRVVLLGVFDVGSWARYTPYHSGLWETALGTAVAVAVLAVALWGLPSWPSSPTGLMEAARRLPVALYGLFSLLLVLALLADSRGFLIVVVQLAIVIVTLGAFGARDGPPARALPSRVGVELTRTR